METMNNLSKIYFKRSFSTTHSQWIARTFISPKFSKISPKRASLLGKSQNFDWQQKYRQFKLEQSQAIEKAKSIKFDHNNTDINSKNVFKVESILPEMDIYYNTLYDYFVVVHGTKKKVIVDETKAIIDDSASRKKAVERNSFIINDEIKRKIHYLQQHDPNCIWTSLELSKQFRIPVEAVIQQTPPTESQIEAARYYKLFQAKLSVIDRKQHKLYLVKKRYLAIEEMKAALGEYPSATSQ